MTSLTEKYLLSFNTYTSVYNDQSGIYARIRTRTHTQTTRTRTTHTKTYIVIPAITLFILTEAIPTNFPQPNDRERKIRVIWLCETVASTAHEIQAGMLHNASYRSGYQTVYTNEYVPVCIPMLHPTATHNTLIISAG